jgi:hypothetical protein
MIATTITKVIGPYKRASRRYLDPSRFEYDREYHLALRGNAVARSYANSASLVHIGLFITGVMESLECTSPTGAPLEARNFMSR